MFVCEACHEKHFGPFWHFARSYGRCEVCETTTTCGDCHCHPKPREIGVDLASGLDKTAYHCPSCCFVEVNTTLIGFPPGCHDPNTWTCSSCGWSGKRTT